MSDVFYEMSKVTIKPVVNYTVLQIFLISSLNFNIILISFHCGPINENAEAWLHITFVPIRNDYGQY